MSYAREGLARRYWPAAVSLIAHGGVLTFMLTAPPTQHEEPAAPAAVIEMTPIATIAEATPTPVAEAEPIQPPVEQTPPTPPEVQVASIVAPMIPPPVEPPPPEPVKAEEPPQPDEPPPVVEAIDPEVVPVKEIEEPPPTPRPRPVRTPPPRQTHKPAERAPVAINRPTAPTFVPAEPTFAPAVAAAPPAAAPVVTAPSPTWLATVRAKLERNKVYPESARFRRQEGTALIRFVVDRNGRVLSYTIVRSSGVSLLDSAAEDMVRRASPVPPIPADMPNERVELTVPVAFALR